VSRHHMLPPLVMTPEPPKPKETKRKRGIGGVWQNRGTDATDEADETSDSARPAPTQRANQRPLGTPIEAADRRIPSTSGKLSDDTLKAMLEAQEVTTKDGSSS
jgi:hypothetical protein